LRRRVELSLDGRAVRVDASGEYAATLDPGRHSVEARHDGYRRFVDDRVHTPGSSARIDVTMQQLPARLSVASNVVGANVLLDGARVGSVPYDAETEPGRRRLEVSSRGYVTHRSVINLIAGAPVRVRADLSPEPVSVLRRWWFWSAVAVVVTGVAVTTYVLVGPPSQPPPYEGGSLNWVAGQGTAH
jgi:hypothetical protein